MSEVWLVDMDSHFDEELWRYDWAEQCKALNATKRGYCLCPNCKHDKLSRQEETDE